MKAITVKQPWASLIIEGVKDIENRTWKCPQKYIGKRILIHASQSPVKDKWRALNQDQIREACKYGLTGAEFEKLPYGAIIGSVEIVDCVINHPSIWAEKSVWTHNRADFKPTYNWVLSNPIKFDKPIPCKGKLSFWDFDETLIKNLL